MVELVLTWNFVEKNIELVFEKMENGDEKTKDAMNRLREINPDRYKDLINAWKNKSFEEYRKKW